MFRVLGGVAVEVEGRLLPLPPQLQRLLGVLLAERGHSVETDVIVDRLWEPPAPKTAVKTVQVLVGRLRRHLAPAGDDHAIATAGHGYRLVEPRVDVDEYLTLVDRAERDAPLEPAAALRSVERALSLWCGRPWGEQADEPWLAPTVNTLEERHRRTEELWADLALECADAELPIERLHALAVAEPLRERRWVRLMLGLYRSGRQGDALRAYEHARVSLRDELGIEPGPELRNVHLRVLQHDASLMRAVVTDAATSTSFVGRGADLARVRDALARNRVVTIVGLGGMGKSRLAAEYVHRQRLDGAHTHWVPLGGIERGDRLAAHVAETLGVHSDDARSVLAAVVARIGRDPVLVVLDGAEALPTETAAIALRLVDDCPRARVLVTSRVPIGLAGERVVELGPLELPTDEGAVRGTALELLVDRLGLDAAAIDLSTRKRLAAACRGSGGVPLLVELLAGNMDASLEQPDWAALDRAAASHERVVRDAIADALAAVDLLPAQLARLMAPLPGGVSERTAAALMNATDDAARRALRLLAWTHVVDAHAGRGSLRYRSLDPVREALVAELDPRERSDAIDRATSALVDTFRSVREPGEPLRIGKLDALDDEIDNLRFLLDDRLANEPRRALALATRASEYWPARGHLLEGQRWMRRCLEAATVDGASWWEGVIALARTMRSFAEIAAVRDQLEDIALDMRGNDADPIFHATSLVYLAMARGWQGDRSGASTALDEAEAIDDRHGNAWSRAQIDQMRDLDRALGGDFLGAREGMRRYGRLMESLDDAVSASKGWYLAATMGDMAGRTDVRDDIVRARELAESHRDPWRLGQLIRLEARLMQRIGDPEGRRLLHLAAARLEEYGGLRAAALARLDIALLELDDGREASALEELRVAVPVLAHVDLEGAALAAGALATVAVRRGDEMRARRLVADARAIDRAGLPPAPSNATRLAKLLRELPDAPASSASAVDAAADVVAIVEEPPFR